MAKTKRAMKLELLKERERLSLELAQVRYREFKIKEGVLQIQKELLQLEGKIADSLKKLKSESGKPFVENQGGGAGLKLAFTKAGERAYFCKPEHSQSEGCGWVVGRPVRKSFNNIGPLCGSAGHRYICSICGATIQTVTTMFS